jgi:hypothetical protein
MSIQGIPQYGPYSIPQSNYLILFAIENLH